MAKFDTNTLSLFHTFSKTQVNSDATKPQYSSLGNTVNKSGHTVQTSEVWADSIPFFGLGVPADFTATAKLNDLVKDADGVIWQRNATAAGAGECWDKKTTSITAFTVGADGKYTYTYTDGALVDGSYLINADGKPVVKYHERKQLTRLVSGNNAFIDSENDASRLKIGGAWVEQFIGVTDAYVNGSASVSYAPVLYANSTATSPLKAGAGEDYLDYCATGIILWDKSEATGNEVINCFEYVGEKLDDTVAKLSAAVFGSGAPSEGEQPASLQQQVAQNTAAITNITTVTIPAIEQSVTNAITTAQGYTDDKIADELEEGGSIAEAIATAKQGAIDSAKVTLTAGNGISIPNSGTPQTSFSISVNEAVVATRTYAEDQATSKANAALAEAKTYAESQASTAKSEAISSANDYTDDEITKAKSYAEEKAGAVSDALNTAKGELTTAIDTAKGEAIAAAKTETESQVATLKTELTTGDGSLGGKVTALEGEVSTIKSTTIPTAKSEAIAAAKTETETQIAALKKTLEEGVIATAQNTANQGVTDAAAAQATANQAVTDAATAQTAAEGAQSAADKAQGDATQALADAEAAQSTADTAVANAAAAQSTADTAVANAAAAQGTADAAKATADTAVQSASGDTYVSAAKEVGTTNIKVTTNISAIDAELAKTTSAVGAAVKAASDAAAQALTDAKKYTDDEIDKVEKSISDALTAHSKDIAKVEAAISSLSTSGFERIIVSELPATDIKLNAIYLVPMTTAEKELNGYAEYIYVGGTVTEGVVSGGKFEQIGTTKTDLAEYAKTADVDALADEVAANKTAAEKAISDLKDGSDKTIATLATEIAAAQGDVDALETVVSALSQTHASDKAALEASIDAVSAKIGDDSVATQIDDAIKALDVAEETKNGITYSQTDGKVAINVSADGVVTQNSTNVVTSGAVYAAVANATNTAGAAVAAVQQLAQAAQTAAQGAQSTADTALANAATAQGAAEAAQTTADSKIAAVEVTTDADTHLGAHHISATTDTDKKVTVAVSCSDEWEYTGAALTVASVINGKMSDGKTIDDANLTSAEGMFMNDESLTTYVGSLGKLTNGKDMFKGCTGLTTFVADLASLTDGTGMFEGCALTEESVMYIVDSLPTTSGKTITIGTNPAIKEAYTTEAANKGWTLA